MMTDARIATLIGIAFLCSGSAFASDSEDLETLLQEFLAATSSRAAHEVFWAEDLVYTSSAGLRFGKPDIMASFDEPAGNDAAPDTVYSADEIDIRVFDDTAVVAFRLVAATISGNEDSPPDYYFNTGTFLKRGGVWRVVAWQATRIPAGE